MHPKDIKIETYNYTLPEEKIATFPLAERDASKLLVYKSGQIEDQQFDTIAAYLPEDALMVYNQTKVVHARLLFKKPTGGKVEVFCLEPDARYADVPTAMLSRGSVYWKCFLGGASKWKEGLLVLETEDFIMHAERVAQQDGAWVLKLSWTDPELSFAEVLHKAGKVPLPPYLNREATAADEASYQSIFAKEEGSVAAPTASLHFTPGVLASIAKKGVSTLSVTLHVGAGTFKPVKSETMEDHEMHAEWLEVSKAQLTALAKHLSAQKPLVAVGTTSCRTLESLYWIGIQLINGVPIENGAVAVTQWLPYEAVFAVVPAVASINAIISHLEATQADKLMVKTQIIIAPGYDFKIVNGLITNFHQPESTLLLLVAALIGTDWKSVYEHALKNNYRFLSYGDSSLLWYKDLPNKKA
ncbi:MAG: S-adenosylmethionine:tRNA ribosyltransferase-isomerase [Sphingobacteriales bacterium]|nr:MAG: S-adenosylmethionine:tRNA ribosyltransferase-isomerase [Sphingobacteriales bacterium]